MPCFLGMSDSRAGGSVVRSCEGQPARPVGGTRIRAKIEERCLIKLFHRRLVPIPTDTVIETQLGCHLPGVTEVSDPDICAWIPRGIGAKE